MSDDAPANVTTIDREANQAFRTFCRELADDLARVAKENERSPESYASAVADGARKLGPAHVAALRAELGKEP